MSQHYNSNEVFKLKRIRPAPLQPLRQLNFQEAIKESCWKHTIKSKQANVPPLRKEGNRRKSWVISFGKQIMLTLGWTVLGAKLQDVTSLSLWVVSICQRMYWPLELLNSVQPSFRCTDESLDHNLLSEAVPPPSILSQSS